MLGLTKREVTQALRRDRRVRRAAAVHRRAGEDVLVGHVHAARLCRGDSRRSGCAARRRSARGGRRRVHAQVPRQVRRVQAAGQDDPAGDPFAQSGRAVLRRSAVARRRESARVGRSEARRRRVPDRRRQERREGAGAAKPKSAHRAETPSHAVRARAERPGSSSHSRLRRRRHDAHRRGPMGLARDRDHRRDLQDRAGRGVAHLPVGRSDVDSPERARASADRPTSSSASASTTPKG